MELTNEQINEIIQEAQRYYIAKPRRACVSSESSFVYERIWNAGNPKFATMYWNWVTMGMHRDLFNEETKRLQEELKKIDHKFVMPEWGTYGT